ncbi:uncharacterized protein [Pyrus communis]|uniref:uncharacterized protein n=1 Tax=Pyrus communis TaxID=23211 RepID=UPI0035BF1804
MKLDGDNVLHLAASSCSKSQCQSVLKILIDLCRDSTTGAKRRSLIRVQNMDGNNALHQVSVSGSVEAAKFLVREFNEPVAVSTGEENNDALPLLRTRNHLGETPLYKAATVGHTELVKFYLKTLKDQEKYKEIDCSLVATVLLFSRTNERRTWIDKPSIVSPNGNCLCLPVGEDVDTLTPDQYDAERGMDSDHLRQSTDSTHHQDDVESGHLRQSMDSTRHQDDVGSGMDTNHPRQSIFRKKLAEIMQDGIIYRIWKDKKNKKSLKKLIRLLVKSDSSWFSTDKQKQRRTISLGSWNELIDGDEGGEKGKPIAEETESDKTNDYDGGDIKKEATIKEILEQYPQAVEHVNENEHNILHLAIKYRQKKIFDLIKSNLIVMSKLSKRIDRDGNTILHQAADRSYYSVSLLSQKLIGPAMQLQDELRWFQRVKEIVPPHYTIHHNKKDQTADELFNYWHDDLLEQAQKWVKETAQSWSTVAVLVATVVFAAAYTTPGGTNDQNGLPLFQNVPVFLLFTSMDVLAIASSLSSVAFFLSILSSPLEYPLFVSRIPTKVMAGFIFLFISMATTMLAFAATILLLIRVEKKWTKSLLYPIAFFPVPLFGLLQFPMYQSFRAMFHEITDWFFEPFFKPLLYFLGFRRSIWCKSKKHE